MIQIGRTQRMTVAEFTPHGLSLTDGERFVLLPNRFVPPRAKVGDVLEVFVTTDSEDRPVATTQRPAGEVGSFAMLSIKEVTEIGAFADWGLDKDLLIPFREQRSPLRAGQRAIVRIELDLVTQRVFGSTRLTRYVESPGDALTRGQEVAGLVTELLPIGIRVIVDGKYSAMLFPDEAHRPLRVGDRVKMYVKSIREDGAVALSLAPAGREAEEALGPAIVARLRREGGFLDLADHSEAYEIREAFGVSKSTYKRAIGRLQREGLIQIEYHGIRLVTDRP